MFGFDNEKVYAQVIGRKVLGVIDADGVISLTLDNGQMLQLDLEGDCCSSSYFTDAKQFDELKGSVIQKLEERSDDPKARTDLPESDNQGECISWHFLVFETDKGHVTIDWRNDSNGYYDGWVIPRLLGKAA